ncbi:hypothetical protein HK105_205371 [Polyrhizophydium stewartii]|uniref:Ankyrin repeat protein n=1 Tax=Polyrhizophydium stewartii TaxID=2732419 RepID=A0ABR4N669_9FUNG|nr:hypothetical protein HK105_007929 [Polyrhizophydium stewartii]
MCAETRRSHWDRLPAEMHREIIGHSGLLTKLTTGLIDNVEMLPYADKLQLWREAFTLEDMSFSLELLPTCELPPEVFALIRSRAVYDRAQALNSWRLNAGLRQAAVANGWEVELSFDEPDTLLELALTTGAVWLLRELVEERRLVVLTPEHAEEAAWAGHLDIIKYLHARMPEPSAGGGDIGSALRDDDNGGDGAGDIGDGDDDDKDRGDEEGEDDDQEEEEDDDDDDDEPEHEPWGPVVVDTAAACGHLQVVEFLLTNRSDGCTAGAVDWAARNGHIHVLEWFHHHPEHSHLFSASTMDFAACAGVKTMRWLHQHRPEGCTTQALASAAQTDDADAVSWLLANITGVEWDLRTAIVSCSGEECEAVIRRFAADRGVEV